jgi:hypothetical protein
MKSLIIVRWPNYWKGKDKFTILWIQKSNLRWFCEDDLLDGKDVLGMDGVTEILEKEIHLFIIGFLMFEILTILIFITPLKGYFWPTLK